MNNLFLSAGLLTERDIADHFHILMDNVEADLRQGKINQQQRDIKVLELKRDALEAIKAVHQGWVVPPPPARLYQAAARSPGPTITGRNSLKYLPGQFSGLTNAQMRALINQMTPGWFDLEEQKKELAPEQTFGEITAFRVWRIRDSTGLLTSSFRTEHTWKPQEVLQSHKKPEPFDSVAAFSKKVGIHAWKSVFEVSEYAAAFLDSWSDSWYDGVRGAVIGRVHLWGEVIEHERGYRAEFARIISIDDCIDFNKQWDGEELERLRATYFPKEGEKAPEYTPNSHRDWKD